MNECYFIGTIISKIEFYFMLGKEHNSVVKYQLKLLDGIIINIKSYDEIADYCYRDLSVNSVIFVKGKIQSNFEIIVNDIEEIKKIY